MAARQDRAECWAAKEANYMLSETSSPGITLELQDKRLKIHKDTRISSWDKGPGLIKQKT